MRHLDLFSGIGGFALAASRVWNDHQVVSFCDIEPFAQKVLKKHWSDVPCHDDIKTMKGSDYANIDLLTGGFPCQPFSQAGQRRGSEDDRHLWPEMLRIIREAKPRWIVGENVRGLTNWNDGVVFDEVLSDLEAEGYSVQSFLIPACAVDAPHRRDRVWIVANARHSESQGWNKPETYNERCDGTRSEAGREPSPSCSDVADTQHIRLNECQHERQPRCREGLSEGDGENVSDSDSGTTQKRKCGVSILGEEDKRWETVGLRYGINEDGRGWISEPELGRVANGVPSRVDRLKGLGNAIVPQVAEMIFRAIRESE